MRSLAENEGIADKSMFSGSPRYSAVFIVIDNGEVPERITEMSGQGEKGTREGSEERRNRSCVEHPVQGMVCFDEKDTEGH